MVEGLGRHLSRLAGREKETLASWKRNNEGFFAFIGNVHQFSELGGRLAQPLPAAIG